MCLTEYIADEEEKKKVKLPVREVQKIRSRGHERWPNYERPKIKGKKAEERVSSEENDKKRRSEEGGWT